MAFFAAKPDEHDEADLREDVVVHALDHDAGDRGEDAHRHDQDDRDRQRPAFVLRRQHEEDESTHSGKMKAAPVARQFLLERPFRSTQS